MKKIIYSVLLATSTAMLVACGGGGSDGESIYIPDFTTTPSTVSYITWTGSDNTTNVIDATNDFVKFRSDNGAMMYGSTTFTNITVDKSNGKLSMNGNIIGGISLIKSSTNGKIAAMVCSDGSLVDIFGTESNLTLGCSSVYPTYATSSPSSDKVVSTISFQLASAWRHLNAVGQNVTLTARGSSANETTLGLCSGTRTFNDAPASGGATFLGSTALSAVGVSTTTWTNCTPASSSSTGTSYYDTNYNDIGSISQSGRLGQWISFTLPATVKVGDVGIIGVENYYTDITKTTPDGRREVSYLIEADTSNTAVINIISKYYNPFVTNNLTKDGKLALTTQYRYRLDNSSNSSKLISSDLQYYIAGANLTAHHYVFGI
jgi:hypothetical protein